MKKATLIFIFCFSACAHREPLVTTGETLIGMADLFVQTAGLMESNVESGKITKAQYTNWVKFAVKFQQLYPAAVSMWKIAQSISDPKLESNMVSTITDLAVQLAFFKEL